MKFFSTCLYVFYSFLFSSLTSAYAETTEIKKNLLANHSYNDVPTIKDGNYLIVGSFSLLRNAQGYKKTLEQQSYKPKLAYYSTNNIYYVYLYDSKDIAAVRKERDKIRQNDSFHDAWVLILEKDTPKRDVQGVVASNTNSRVTESTGEAAPTEAAPALNLNKEGNEQTEYKEYKVYMNVFAEGTFKEIPSVVKVIYGDKDEVVGFIESQKQQTLKLAKEGLQEIQLVCEVFGYRKIEQDLNLNQPTNESSKSYVHVDKDVITVDFELIKYRKGDIFTMFNVFFHTDAAVMLPKSIHELNSLLEMVKENENLKIMLHGHTNGNAGGAIIKPSKTDTDFFNFSPSNERGKGSAKELSSERANTIKRYLVSQGISADRIEVKGWGGSKQIYESKSPEAKKNVRVEVEILKD